MNRKWLDTFTLFLSVFAFVVLVLFYFLSTIDKSINEYSKDHDRMIELQLLDKEFDNFLLQNAYFSNYDVINTSVDKFRSTLSVLNDNLVYQNSDNDIMNKVDSIQKTFDNKYSDIEYFKSLNASLLNSSHFLYDLHKNISENPKVPQNILKTMSETLFFLLQFSVTNYMDKKRLQQSLEKIHTYQISSGNQYIHNFYIQSQLMLSTLDELKVLSSSFDEHHLALAINALHQNLDKRYHRNFLLQKLIASTLIILIIIMIFILIKMHIKGLKYQRELQAFSFAMQHSDNTIVITDADRNITFVNDVFEKTTGYTYDEALGENPRILKSGKQEQSYYDEMNKKLDRGEKWEGEFINKRKDGSLYYEKASIVPVFLNKELIYYLAIKLDITKYVEQNLRLEQAASVFENTEEAIIITDASNKIISINHAFTQMYGYEKEEILGQYPNLIRSQEHESTFYKDMWNQILSKKNWRGKIINCSKSGELIPVWMSIKMITNDKDEITSFTAVQTDLRDIELTQKRADFLAYHDPLTELSNRVNFEGYFIHAIEIAKRKKEKLALLFIDLDRFKIINDTLGHDIGDDVLKAVASRLSDSLRESDLIARWGGDEFVILLENLVKPTDAARIATNLLDILTHPIDIGIHHLNTTASIGIAIYPDDGEDYTTLMKHADSAMYLAKDIGKNNFQYYTNTLSQESKKKLDIDSAMRVALKRNEFYLHYQPQYDLKTKQIIGVEALIRWYDKVLGQIPPNDFIPIAEDSSLIIPIGYFVFEQACQDFSKMLEAGLGIKYLSINVSSIQFREQHLLDHFITTAKHYNLEPSQIEIEITERYLMEQTTQNLTLLQSFRMHGFKISIDDFGTGYSSMSYLKKLPIDIIKIDKSFIDDIKEDGSGSEITQAIIALSKKLNYIIIAEGIETQVQEDILAHENCDLGQGYLFSRPLGCDDLITKFL